MPIPTTTSRAICFAPWRLRRLLEQNFTYTPVRFCGSTSQEGKVMEEVSFCPLLISVF